MDCISSPIKPFRTTLDEPALGDQINWFDIVAVQNHKWMDSDDSEQVQGG